MTLQGWYLSNEKHLIEDIYYRSTKVFMFYHLCGRVRGQGSWRNCYYIIDQGSCDNCGKEFPLYKQLKTMALMKEFGDNRSSA